MKNLHEGTTKKILLAEDDNDDMDIFIEALSEINKDINVKTFYNGQRLLEALRKNNYLPDIVFLDLNMPVLNGFECLKVIKETTLWNNVKVVILSTSSNPEQIKTAYKLGADLYITKSANFLDYRGNLKKCLDLYFNDSEKF
jgi:CheY-like chemotaxis protein